MEINFNNAIDKNATLEERFSNLASQLFDCWCIQVKDTKFYFTELEFYYYDKQDPKLQDPFCLCREDQQPGKPGYPFCFHKYGMDIIIGTQQSYGGVLVRGLKDEGDNFVEGTKRLFTWILPLIDRELTGEMYDMNKHAPLLKEAVKNKELQLVPTRIMSEKPPLILQGPRIIGTRKKDQDSKFQLAPFRYIIDYRHNPCKKKESLLFWSACLHKKISLEQAIQSCGCGKVWQKKIIDYQKQL